MSIELNQSILQSISTANPHINNAAVSANQYTEMCKEGRISTQELQELLLDIQRQVNIDQNMSDLESLERLNTAINGLISIAKMAV